MDLLAALGVLMRRWYVVVPLLAATAWAAVLGHRAVEPSYTATGTLLLLAPLQSTDPATGHANPYLGYGDLKIPADVVSQVVRRPQMRERLREAGAARYQVGVDAFSNAPMVVVTASGRASHVRSTARTVMSEVTAELARLQLEAGAPESTLITARPITMPERITAETGSRIRVLVGTVFVGLTVTVATAFLVEAAAEGLRRRAASRPKRARYASRKRWRSWRDRRRRSEKESGAEIERDRERVLS